MIPFTTDPVYLEFLAVHAGIWGEVGVFEDPALLAALRCKRRLAGLPCDRWTPSDPSSRTGRLAVVKRALRPLQDRQQSSSPGRISA